MKPLVILIVLGLALAGIGGLINQTVGWGADNRLVGTWSCKANTDDAELQVEMEFMPGGVLNRTLWLRAHSGRKSVAAKMTSQDRWDVRGDTLRIAHGELALVSVTGDENLLPKKMVEAIFEPRLLGATHHTIMVLGEKALTYGASGGPARCERLA